MRAGPESVRGVLIMNNNDKLRRSNLVLIGLVVLVLLYGLITRIMTGDKSLYIFGIPVIENKAAQEESTEGSQPDTDARALFESVDALLG